MVIFDSGLRQSFRINFNFSAKCSVNTLNIKFHASVCARLIIVANAIPLLMSLSLFISLIAISTENPGGNCSDPVASTNFESLSCKSFLLGSKLSLSLSSSSEVTFSVGSSFESSFESSTATLNLYPSRFNACFNNLPPLLHCVLSHSVNNSTKSYFDSINCFTFPNRA